MLAPEENIAHVRWECKFHMVFIPKFRRKSLFGLLKRNPGRVFHELVRQKECRIAEGHLMSNHVHILILIPPKYADADYSKSRKWQVLLCLHVR